MPDNFDPYYKWLGIPPKDQPPHHYRLLGIEVFEPDREVIDAAANRLMGYLKELAAGDDAAHSQKLLNEISRARLCLLNKDKKAAYDCELKAKLQVVEEKPASQTPETAQPPQPPPPAFPPLGELPAITAPPRIEIGTPVSRLDTRSKPPPLKSRGSPAPIIRENAEPDSDDQSDEETGRPVVTRRSNNKTLYVAAAAAAAIVIIAAVGAILMQPARVDDSPARPPGGQSPQQASGPRPVVTLVLTEEERNEVTAFFLDDEAQSLPPPVEVTLNAGRHHIILRRKGYEEVFDTITLVRGVRRDYRPRWKREMAKTPVPAAATTALPPLVPEAKPLPEMPAETPVPVETPGAAATPAPQPEPPPEPAAPSPTPTATDAEVQEAAAHGFASGFGQVAAAWLLNGDGIDQSGHRRNGIAMMASGGTPSYVEGRIGTGLQVTPEVRFEVAEPVLTDASEFSVAAWVNLASLPEAAGRLIDGETTAICVQGGFPRVEIGGRKPLAGPDTDPATGGFRGIELSSTLNTWVHLGFVFAARLRQVHYYLNGEHRGCQQFADALPATWNRTVVTGWSGILDETRVFNYRLSSSDMKAVFAGTYEPPPAPPRQADGVLVCETWFGVAPTSPRHEVDALLVRTPDATSVIETSLSCVMPASAGDRLDRIRGFLFPPATGEYTFQLQGSGRATLYLQQSGPLQDTLQEMVVSEPGQPATSPRVALDTGRPRYFEIRHCYRGDAGPSLRLGWRLPGSAEDLEAISAADFSSYRGRPSPP